MKQQNIVRLKDIAEELGVSVNSVSRALKDAPDISKELKIKVKAKAAEMGYIPNNIFDYIRGGKTDLIGIVVNSLINPYFTITSTELIAKFQDLGYSPVILITTDGLFTMDLLMKLLLNRVVAIVSLTQVTEEVYELCCKKKIPFLTVGTEPLNKKINCIYTDNYACGKLIAEVYDAQKYQRPCYISCVASGNFNRKKGFVENVKASNVAEYKWLHYESSPQDFELFLDTLIQNKNDFIYCFNDEIASCIIDGLEQRGYQNYAIYGTDAVASYYNFFRSFPSVGVKYDELTRNVLTVLDKEINGTSDETTQICLEPKLL